MHRTNGAYNARPRMLGLEEPPTGPRFANHGLTTRERIDICNFLLLSWQMQEIADRLVCSRHAVDNVRSNLITYRSVRKPLQAKLGRPGRITDWRRTGVV